MATQIPTFDDPLNPVGGGSGGGFTTTPTPGRPAGAPVTPWFGVQPILIAGAPPTTGGLTPFNAPVAPPLPVGGGGLTFTPCDDSCNGGGVSTSGAGQTFLAPATSLREATSITVEKMNKNYLWLAVAFAAGWYIGKMK